MSSPPRYSAHQVGVSRGHERQGPTPVTAYGLRSESLHVEVWDHGARLVAVETADHEGVVGNLVLRHDTLADYDDPSGGHAYFGATIGRYANRIARSRFLLDGRAIEVEPNESGNQLHGGPLGFDQVVWSFADGGASDSGAFVSLRHVSPDGDQGFPGTVTVTTTFEVAGDELRIDTMATTDAPTVMGSTNHAYWNLAGGGTVEGHRLTVDADRYLDVDAELLPSGAPLNVGGTSFDFRAGRDVDALLIDGGIDHCLVMRDALGGTVTLTHEASGRSMVMRSNQPGVQVYTGQYLPVRFAGMCLEPQALPDTPNHPEYGTCELRPGEVYHHSTSYTFSCSDRPGR